MSFTDDEKRLIQSFIANKPMAEAIRKALLVGIYQQGKIDCFDQNWVFSVDSKKSDTEYGRAVKVIVHALSVVKEAFDDMARVIVPSPDKPRGNPAR